MSDLTNLQHAKAFLEEAHMKSSDLLALLGIGWALIDVAEWLQRIKSDLDTIAINSEGEATW